MVQRLGKVRFNSRKSKTFSVDHIACEGVPEAVYSFMVKEEAGEQLLWTCKQCKRGCAKLYQYVKRIEGQHVELMNKQKVLEEEVSEIRATMTEGSGQLKAVEHRLGDTEAKALHLKEEVEVNTKAREGVEQRLGALEAKAVKMEDRIKDVNTTRGSDTAQVDSGGNVTDCDLMKELNERKARENNIVVQGAHESRSEEVRDRINHDRNLALKLLNTCAVSGGHENVVFVKRLGKSLPEKIRPLLVVLPDRHTKDKMFMNLRSLNTCEEMKHIRVRHDLTRKEREEEGKLQREAKNLSETGQGKHRVVGPPWRRRVVKMRDHSAITDN